MRHLTGILSVAVLALLLTACEREEPQVQQEPAKETRATETEATQEEKAALPVINEKIEEEAEQRDMLEPSEPVEGDTASDTQQTARPAEPAAEEQEAGEQPAAIAAPGEMPQTVTYDASFGAVTFDHAAHSEMLECGNCHATDPPQRIVIDKERAHDMCKGCHQEQGAGPTGCRGCHQEE